MSCWFFLYKVWFFFYVTFLGDLFVKGDFYCDGGALYRSRAICASCWVFCLFFVFEIDVFLLVLRRERKYWAKNSYHIIIDKFTDILQHTYISDLDIIQSNLLSNTG